MKDIGISFQPGQEGDNGQQQTAEPLQEAVKLLNLRLPSVLGASSPVHPSLLQATGLQGQPDMAFLRQLLGLGPEMPRAGVPDLGSRFPGLGQGPQPQPNIIVGKPPNFGGGQNPEHLGPQQPGGALVPWPGGPFSPSPPGRPQPASRGQFSR